MSPTCVGPDVGENDELSGFTLTKWGGHSFEERVLKWRIYFYLGTRHVDEVEPRGHTGSFIGLS